MRLILLGLAAVALFVTEPGKRLQRVAVRTFKVLKCKACGKENETTGSVRAEANEADEEQEESEKGDNGIDQELAEALIERLNAKPSASHDQLKSA